MLSSLNKSDIDGKDCENDMFRCENGPCIWKGLRCNSVVDCPWDTSDELDCPGKSKKEHKKVSSSQKNASIIVTE